MKGYILHHIVVCLLLLLAHQQSMAQIVVKGKITDLDRKPLAGAIVTILESPSSSLSFEICDEEGAFNIEVQSDSSRLQIFVSMMGYEQRTIDIKNQTQTKNIELQPKDFELKEFVIKSDRIWKRNDTIVYSVDAFKNAQDRTIADLLKKLPGVEVSESGAVKYQGESINKFYIEGMDLMESKYGLATNNMPVDAVQNVEVIENHQPIKALNETMFSEKAAINLKLKNGKVGRPIGNVIAGTGFDDKDWLWLLNILGLQVNKTNQTMIIYKTNNTGLDITKEMDDLISLDELELETATNKPLFKDNNLTGMELEDKRYLFNKSHLLTVNHLKKINENKEIRVNANYMYDERTENIEQSFSYFSPTSPLYVNEISKPIAYTNKADMAITYMENSKQYYLNNKLETKLKWNKLDNMVFSDNNIGQKYNLPEYGVNNNLQLVKNFGEKVWNITSKINYTYKPQDLIVDNDLYKEEQRQNIEYKGIYADMQSSYSISNRNSTFTIKAKVLNLNESLDSDLRSFLITDSTKNKLTSNQFQVIITPQYQWNYKKTKVTLKANISEHILSTDNKYYKGKKDRSRFLISPRATINKKINSYWESILTYSYNQQLGDIFDHLLGYTQYDYMNYRSKTGILSDRKTHITSLRFNYKNVMKAFFLNTSFTYIGIDKNLLNKTVFSNTTILSTNIGQDNHSSNWLWYGYIGKYLSSINSNLSLTANLSLSKSQKMQQEKLYPVNIINQNIIVNWTTKFSDALNATYNGSFYYNILKTDSENKTNKNKNQQFSQRFSCYYLANPHWAFSIQGEHLYTKLSDRNTKSIIFGDIIIKYLHSNFDILLNWNNIFNQKQYKTVVYDELNIFTYNYKLRKRNLLISFVYKY